MTIISIGKSSKLQIKHANILRKQSILMKTGETCHQLYATSTLISPDTNSVLEISEQLRTLTSKKGSEADFIPYSNYDISK